MRELSSAIVDARKELMNSGHWDNTIILTTSEFGRRPLENQSRGTDHGTASPHFIVGGQIRGGLIGGQPRLDNVDRNKDLEFNIDYRSIYNSIIEDYFSVHSRFAEFKDKRINNLFQRGI